MTLTKESYDSSGPAEMFRGQRSSGLATLSRVHARLSVDIVARHNIHFDQTRQTGVVLHMMSALGEHGRTGLTAVGNSRDEADAMLPRPSRYSIRKRGWRWIGKPNRELNVKFPGRSIRTNA